MRYFVILIMFTLAGCDTVVGSTLESVSSDQNSYTDNNTKAANIGAPVKDRTEYDSNEHRLKESPFNIK